MFKSSGGFSNLFFSIVFIVWLLVNAWGILFHNFLLSPKLVHFLGGFGLAFALNKLLTNYLSKRQLKLARLEREVVVFMIVSTLGVFDELVDLLFEIVTKRPVLGGRQDTAIDLLLNTVGILLFLILRRIVSS